MGAANESWNVSPSGDGLKSNFILLSFAYWQVLGNFQNQLFQINLLGIPSECQTI